jgi:tape measure domain-containing protein
MAGAVSNLMVRAGVDGSQLTRGLQQMQGEMRGAQSSIGSTLGSIGKVTGAAVAAAGAALIAMGGYIAKTGIAYDQMQENSQVAWTTLLGSQEKAKQQLKDIADFAKNTQFDTEGVDAMAKYMFNAGLSGKGLMDELQRIADISGAFNISAADAQELARQMSQVDQAGVAYTEDLNILQDRGVPIYKAIAKELGTNVAAVRKMASEGKITSDIYNKAFNDIANGVKGASDAQSKTMSGMISTLKDDFSIISGILAKPIFNVLHDGLTKLMPIMDSVTSLARGDFKGFYDTLDQAFGENAAKMISGFVEKIASGINNIKSGLDVGKQALIDFYNKAKENLGGPLTNIFNTLKDIGGTAFKDISKFVQNAFKQIREFWEKDGDKIMAAVKQSIQDISAALDASKPFLKAVFDIITGVGIQAFNDFMKAIKWVSDNLNWLIPVAAGVVAGIGAFKIIEGVITLMQTFTAVTKLLDAAWIALDIVMDANPIGLIALAIGGLITAGILLYQNWDTVKNKMQVIWMEIKAGAQDAVNGVIDKINELIRLLNKIPGVSIPLVPKVNFDVLSSVRAAPGSAPNGYGRSGGAQKAFASGTNYAPGGLALVGELGPEIVDLPRGSKVYTNSETKQMLNGNFTPSHKTYNVTVNSLQASMDEKDLVRALQRMEALNYV